jgi:hypothetical protein
MKSGGGSSTPPNQPQPQGGVVPYGQTSPQQPPYQSFLPSDPNAMATEMPAMPVQQAAAPPPQQGQSGPPMDQNMMRQMLSQIMAQQRHMNNPLMAGLMSQINGASPGYGQGGSGAGAGRGPGSYSSSGGVGMGGRGSFF